VHISKSKTADQHFIVSLDWRL